MKKVCLALALLASVLSAPASIAQQFPSKPIRIVVAGAAGSVPDIVARTVAEPMGKQLGQAVIVENRPGANMMIGFEYVAKQPSDGYTLALVFPTALATLPTIVKEMRFDVLKDLPPIIRLVDISTVFTVNGKKPWKTLDEFAADARANPGKYNYATTATAIQLNTEALLQALGVKVTAVPFASATTSYQALATGDVDVALLSEFGATTIKDRVRVLAASGGVRAANFPDAPSVKELGLLEKMGVDMMTSLTLNAPAGTPKPILDVLYAAAKRALDDPTTRQRFATMGGHPVTGENTPQSNQRKLEAEAALFNPLAKRLGIGPVN